MVVPGGVTTAILSPGYDWAVTVAAVVLASPEDDVTTPILGQPRVRRLVDIAWSGGALPIVVVSLDPSGAVAGALAGSPATLAAPAPAERGPAGHIAGGVRDAIAAVEPITAALLWPARRAWVDPETVTSLIEAHGADPGAVLRPSFRGEGGWPVLFPVAHLAAVERIAPHRSPDEVIADLAADGIPVRLVDLGDPGCTHDAATAPGDLPAFHGPEEPVAGPPPEWGAGVAGDAADAGTA
jgi:CTP:molybdopterin cytidylyltransferase MocA